MCDLDGALESLRTHLPDSDLRCYPEELFRQFAQHALMLRETVPWCAALDEEIFLHYVLCPRVNDEDLSFHRRIFYDALWPRVRDLPGIEEAVLEVDRWCAEIASYEMTDARTASPLTVWRCGSGRCGEESAFLVSALRSVGIPARQVYVPRWSHCDDNHAWVEALCGDRWRFLGACEPEPVLDRGWFNTSASRAVLVHSRLFGEGRSPLHGVPIGRDGDVTFYDQTARYAPVSERTFRALVDGRPAAGAVFRLQILNEAAFHTVAALTAGEEGEVKVPLGPGTVHVLAALGDLRAEGDCEGGALDLDLAPAGETDTGWIDFDFLSAQAAPGGPPLLDAAQRAARAEVRRRGSALRTERIAAFAGLGTGEPRWRDLLEQARGNRGEVLAFLAGGDGPDRERLVRSLAAKDLRDTDRETLEDHFVRLPPRGEGIPEEIYWRYVACPRIAREKIVRWRSGQYGAMDAPARRVAALRAAGIPARLRPLDGVPEFWREGAFHPVDPEEGGALRLICSRTLVPESWSLSRRGPEGWQVLDPSGYAWADGCLTVALPAGHYRLVTSTRLPGGGQLAAKRDLPIRVGEERIVHLRLREYDLADVLFCQDMPPVPAVARSGATVSDIFRWDGRPSLLIWLEEGAEPTEHLLLELTARQEAFEALGLRPAFLLRGRESLEQPTLARTLRRWRGIELLFDDWAFDLEDLARRLALDPEAAPLAVLCDGRGHAAYACCGYRVGAADLLLRAAERVCGRSV